MRVPAHCILPYRTVKPPFGRHRRRGSAPSQLSISEEEFSGIQKRSSVTPEIVDRQPVLSSYFLSLRLRCLLAAKTPLIRLASRLLYTQNCLPGRLELSGDLGNGSSIIQPL